MKNLLVVIEDDFKGFRILCLERMDFRGRGTFPAGVDACPIMKLELGGFNKSELSVENSGV